MSGAIGDGWTVRRVGGQAEEPIQQRGRIEELEKLEQQQEHAAGQAENGQLAYCTGRAMTPRGWKRQR
jgi:hypothetical protein